MEQKVEEFKAISGDSISDEEIKMLLRGADGNVQTALNHWLDRKQTTEEDSSEPRNSFSSFETFKQALEAVEDEVTCCICLNLFNDPVTLGCCHSFCRSCLRSLVDKSVNPSCPLCKAEINLDIEDVETFPRNHCLANIVERLGLTRVSSNDEVPASHSSSGDCDSPNYGCNVIQNDPVLSEGNTPRPDRFDILQEVEYVIPFNINEKFCEEQFYKWVKSLWFAPHHFSNQVSLTRFTPMWVPYWQFELDTLSFSMSASSRTNRKSTKHIMVSATEEQVELLQSLEPWREERLEEMNDGHTFDHEIVPFSINYEEAWTFRGKAKFQKQIETEIAKRTDRRYSLGNTNIDVIARRVRKVFVPVYKTEYRYGGNTYSFLVNGSTGECDGTRPYETTNLFALGSGVLFAAFQVMGRRL